MLPCFFSGENSNPRRAWNTDSHGTPAQQSWLTSRRRLSRPRPQGRPACGRCTPCRPRRGRD